MARKLLRCRHTDDMIHKLESAGLGYHVKTEDSEDRLGMKLCSCGYTLVKVNLITFENYNCEKMRVTTDNKQLLDEVFVISRIIEVEVGLIISQKRKAEADNPYQDLDYSGYRKNRI